MEKIAAVILSNTTRAFDKEYHYLIPAELSDIVRSGMRVIVPFGKSDRSLEGYVFKVLEDTDFKELKVIKRIVDPYPVLSPNMLLLAQLMKERYICTYYDVIKAMLPPGIGVKTTEYLRLTNMGCEEGINFTSNESKIIEKLNDNNNEWQKDVLKRETQIKNFSTCLKKLIDRGYIEVFEAFSTKVKEKHIRVAFIAKPREEIIEEIESNNIKKIQQIRVLEMLIDNEHISVADLARFAGVSPSVLDTLKRYGYIEYKDIDISRDPYKNHVINATVPLEPTPEQQKVLKNVIEVLDKECFSEMLLHGVTGSGKTEVYLQLIKHCLDIGKQAIVLVPEISLTPQMVERFKGRFGDDVAVQHSRLSLGERYDQWRLIKEGKINVAVGARSAVFSPFEKLGIIVIDEEHESSYKSETTPKYHAKDVAKLRCQIDNAVLLLGSATPSVESYYKAKHGEITYLEINHRANMMLMPKVQIVDMRNELDEGNRSIFCRVLAQEIQKNIDLKQQTILFLNRRGYASFVLCRSCGYTIRCPYCSVSLTYHSKDERLICHYCGYTTKSPQKCPKCDSTYIRQFGTGTQKVEEELKKSFPGCSVLRMDMDTTSHKNAHEEILGNFRNNNINIMIGTQMIAKGHDFPNVTLVGVLAADSLLNVGDYRASERTFQLLTQVSGRAGRGELPGRVIIQTYNTEDYSIKTAGDHDYQEFYRQEILVREKLRYPPFTNIASIIVSGINDRMVYSKIVELENEIVGEIQELEGEIFGPNRAPIKKLNKKYRWRLIIKLEDIDKLVSILIRIKDLHRKNDKILQTELSVDINPSSML